MTLLLAIAAVAVAMRHYCRSRYDLVAMLKTLSVTLSQLPAFSLSFTLLVMRGDLLECWQQLPPDSPNYFLLNIMQEQVPPVRYFLSLRQVKPETFYPIAHVHLTALNDKKADPTLDNALKRELNLTWMDVDE